VSLSRNDSHISIPTFTGDQYKLAKKLLRHTIKNKKMKVSVIFPIMKIMLEFMY
jgi:hypothetical protein